MAKVKVRTKQGGFRDDRFHLTTKWQDVEEKDISPLWVDSPNIEIKMADGKLMPTPEVLTRPDMERPEPVKEAVEEPEEDKKPTKKTITRPEPTAEPEEPPKDDDKI